MNRELISAQKTSHKHNSKDVSHLLWLSSGMWVKFNTRCIHCTRATFFREDAPQCHPRFVAHLTTQVCTGIRQNQILFQTTQNLHHIFSVLMNSFVDTAHTMWASLWFRLCPAEGLGIQHPQVSCHSSNWMAAADGSRPAKNVATAGKPVNKVTTAGKPDKVTTAGKPVNKVTSAVYVCVCLEQSLGTRVCA